MEDQDLELLQEFGIEGMEHLTEVEPSFLEIEEADEQRRLELVNEIFRAVHSVKGAAGFFELTCIQDLSHAMENLLMRVRDGDLAYQPEMTDALLKGLDKLRMLLEPLPEIVELDVQPEVDSVQAFLSVEAAPKGKASAAPAEAEPAEVEPTEAEPEPAKAEPAEAAAAASGAAESTEAAADFELDESTREEAKRFGHKILCLTLPVEDTSDESRLAACRESASSLGKLIGERRAQSQDGEQLCLLVTTVLEPDIVAGELGVTPEAVHVLEGGGSEPSASAAPPGEKKVDPAAPAGRQGKTAQESAPKRGAASGPARKSESADTIRVQVGLLDKLMNLAGELVLARNQLLSRLDSTDDSGLKSLLQNFDHITSELQGNIMNTRMQPVGIVFKKFNRVVRDMSKKLGKKVDLQLEGADVELDKSIIEMLSDPLTHLIRNSLDHGIETPEGRSAAGKSETGQLLLRAFHEGGQVIIEIEDDGAGIDPRKTRRVAVEKGVLNREEADALSAHDATMLIFAAGFSTAQEVTDVSGRGVGMDVVRSNISKLGGKIEVDSAVGMGTTIQIRLPLTLAIIPSLIVVAGEDRFAIPQVNLVELVRVSASDATNRLDDLNGARVLRLRGRLLPLVHLHDVLSLAQRDAETPSTPKSTQEEPGSEASERSPGESSETSQTLQVAVLKIGESCYGLIVDRVMDSEEIVVKPLSQYLKRCRIFAGATIMGDGKIAMILDVGGIAGQANLRLQDQQAREAQAEAAESERRIGPSRQLVLFTNSPDEQFAVELAEIVRLERIEPGAIEKIGSDEFIQYRGSGLPLLRLEERLPVRPLEMRNEELYVLIPRTGEHSVGILASGIIDTIETSVKLERRPDDAEAVKGRAVLQDRLTVFLDTKQLLAH